MGTVFIVKWQFSYFEHATKQLDVLVEEFYYYYDTWQNSKDATHLVIYFNLKVEKHVYINGSLKNQLEIFDFLDTYEPNGIGFRNLYTKSLRKKIQQIRKNVRYQKTMSCFVNM